MSLGKRVLMVLTAGLLAVGAPAIGTAWAVDESSRAERWQFSLPMTYLASNSWDGAGGSSVDLHADLGFGFGFGYHLTEKFFLGAEWTWIYADYESTVLYDDPGIGMVTLGGELDASSLHFKGQYNILEKTITPFVGASFGWTYIDSNIASGPTQGVCWWDPWWGYVCDTWQPTYDDTGFSYGVNGGLRAEVSEKFFIEVRYNILWIDTVGDNIDADGGRFELGWMF